MTSIWSAWSFLADNHDTIATLAAVVSSLLAFGGLWISARALIQQSRATDAANYLDVRQRLAEAQRKVQRAPDEEQKNFELIELFNLLEALAELYRRKRFGKATRDSVKSDLIGAIHFIDTTPAAKQKMAEAFTHPSAFSALKWFRKKFRSELDRYV